MTLEEQIRNRWGGLGEWNAAGVNRAAELARLLEANGITDLAAFDNAKISETPWTRMVSYGEGNQPYEEAGVSRQVNLGDRNIGFLGNINRKGGFEGKQSDDLQDAGDRQRIGWSSQGDGNVSYYIGNAPDGSLYIAPEWGSSSDMGTVRDLGKGGLLVGGLAYGASLLAPGAAGGAGSAGGGGLLSGGSAVGGGMTAPAGFTGASLGAGTAGGVGLEAGLAGGSGLAAGGSTVGTSLGAAGGSGLIPTGAAATTATGLANTGLGAGASAMNWGQMLKDWGPLVTSVLGAASGARDQTQSASKEPWAAAQPFLKDVLSRAGGMLPQYLDNPISPEQRQAMNNVFGLTNAGMNAVPGLLANMNAVGGGYNRAGGANRTRVGFTPLQFDAGGLLGNFTRGGR